MGKEKMSKLLSEEETLEFYQRPEVRQYLDHCRGWMAKVYWAELDHRIEDMSDKEKDEFWIAEEKRFHKWWKGTTYYEESGFIAERGQKDGKEGDV